MIIAFTGVYKAMTAKNYLFLNPNAQFGDDVLKPWNEYKLLAEKNGDTVCTADMIEPLDADIFVFLEIPDKKDPILEFAVKNNKRRYAVCLESPISGNAFNENREMHKMFDKVFTYRDDLVDGKKYIKINYSFVFPKVKEHGYNERGKFAVILCGNHHSNMPNELYSKRLECINWFEDHHSAELDLYGPGWNKNTDANPVKKFLKCLMRGKRYPDRKYNVYKGIVERKSHVMPRYKFCICYENCSGTPGYITEKIFDCFFSGVVPVYWGAENISSHIPGNCYIDKREFSSYEELHRYLKEMSPKEFLRYQASARSFLSGQMGEAFSSKRFAETLIRNMV